MQELGIHDFAVDTANSGQLNYVGGKEGLDSQAYWKPQGWSWSSESYRKHLYW